MSFKDCIRRSYEQGYIGLEEKQALDKRFDAIVKRVPTSQKAKEAMLAEMEAEAVQRDRRAMLAEGVRKKREQDIFGYRNHRGEQDVAAGYSALFDELALLEEAYLRKLQSMASKFLLHFEKGGVVGDKRRTSKWVGNKQIQLDMEEVKRVQMDGAKASNPVVQAAADGVIEMIEWSRQRFNDLGGSIAKLENWGPQTHERDAIRDATRRAWVEYFQKDDWRALNRDKMINHASGIRLSDAELKEGLEIAWDRITSEGWFDREITAAPTGKGALYKQHQDHRFIHFRNAEEHTRYAKEFGGNPDYYEAISRHMKHMARDLAAMEMFGPNPDAMIPYLKQVAEKHLKSARSNNIVHAEMHDEIRRLTRLINGEAPSPKAATLTESFHEKLSGILETLAKLRDRGGTYERGDKKKIAAMHKALGELEKVWGQLFGAQGKIKDGDIAGVVKDHIEDNDIPALAIDTPEKIAAADRIRELLDDMREEVILPTGNWQSRAERQFNAADRMWAVYSGKSGAPVDHRLAAMFRNARNLLTAARLGTALVPSLGDLITHQRARAFVGSPRSDYASILADMSHLFAGQTREQLVRSWFILDNAKHQVHENARRFGGMQAQTMTSYLADRVVHGQGLQAYTQAGKWAFEMDMMGWFNDVKDKTFGDLSAEHQRTLRRSNITPAEWDQIRSTPSFSIDARAAGILRPNEIEQAHGWDLANKYVRMISRERFNAIHEPTLRVKALLNQGTRPGTPMGELMLSGTQFKSFGVSLTMMQSARIQEEFGRGMREGGTGQAYRSALGYALPFLFSSTIIGAAIIQIRELLAGRDPRPVGTPDQYDFWRFWISASLAGSGWGIYGDFINATNNRFGGGLAGTIAGPMIGESEFVARAITGNIQRFGEGKTPHVGGDVADAVRRWTPFANFWPTRLATERLFFDQVHKALDRDGYEATKRRLMDQRKRDYGNGYFWEPGTTSPQRAPDMSRVTGR